MVLEKLLGGQRNVWANLRMETLRVDSDITLPPNSIDVNTLETGTNGQVLTTVGGVAVWDASSAGIVTASDITPGTNNQILRVIGGVTTWDDTIDVSNISDNSITNAKMTANSIDSANLINESVTAGKIGPNAVTNSKILNNTVTPVKLEPSATNGEVLTTVAGVVEWAAVPSGGSVLASDITPGTENQIMRVVGGVNTWQNNIDISNISDNSITNAKMTVNSVDSANLINESVTTDKLLNSNVTPVKLEPSATNGEVLTTVAGVTAWAAVPTSGTITAADITPGTNNQIMRVVGGVNTWQDTIDVSNISDNSIANSKMTVNSIDSGNLINDSVTTDKILNSNVTPVKLEPSATNGEVLTTVAGVTAWAAVPTSGTITAADITPGTNNQIMRVVGGVNTWQDNIDISNIQDNSITNIKMAANSISNGNLINESVTAGKIGPNAITTGKILNNAVTPVKLEPSAINGEVMTTVAGVCEWAAPPSDVVASDITPGTNNQILRVVGGVTTWQNTIDVSNIADDSITNIKMAADSIDTANLINNAVTTDKILNINVTSNKIASGAVTTAKLADGNVTTLKVADLNITTPKIADSAINTAKILNSNVTPAKLAPSATNGEVLTTVAGVAAWAPSTGGSSEISVFTNPGYTVVEDAITSFTTVANPLGITNTAGVLTNIPAGNYIITFYGQLTLSGNTRARTNLIDLVATVENVLNTLRNTQGSNESSVILTAYITDPTEIYIRARDLELTLAPDPAYGRVYLYVTRVS